jgi:hypothetical protein
VALIDRQIPFRRGEFLERTIELPAGGDFDFRFVAENSPFFLREFLTGPERERGGDRETQEKAQEKARKFAHHSSKQEK